MPHDTLTGAGEGAQHRIDAIHHLLEFRRDASQPHSVQHVAVSTATTSRSSDHTRDEIALGSISRLGHEETAR